MNLRDTIKYTPMRSAQWATVVLCILIAAIDGYEIVIMAFVAPTLAAEWGLTKVTVGYALSSGLAGMAIGAITLAPLSDQIGRRRHVLACLILAGTGMILTGLTSSFGWLLIARFFAGLWIGAIVPSLTAVVAEYCSDKRRGAVMGVFGIGIPLGSVLGGLATGPLIAQWGWQGPFVLTGFLSLILAGAAFAMLPESVEYLVESRPRDALRQYNQIAARYGIAAAEELPPARGQSGQGGRLGVLSTGVMLRRTALLWSALVLVVAALYFCNLWTPTMIADATGDPAQGRLVGVLVSLGGILGTLGYAALSLRWNPRVVVSALAVASLPVYFLFAASYTTPRAKILAVLVGVVTIGSMQAIYAISPYVYPAAVRGSALGFMVGIARGVSIVVPILMGYWFAAGRSEALTFQLYGVVMLIAGLLLYGFHRSYRGLPEDPELAAASSGSDPARAEPLSPTGGFNVA